MAGRWLVATLLGACAPPTVTVGTGEVLYEELVDGQDLPIVQGQQGGLHVFGSLRSEGIEPGVWGDLTHPTTPLVTFELIGPEGLFGGYSRLPRPLKVRQDGTTEIVGELIILHTADVEVAAGMVVSLRVEVEDHDGRVAEDERHDLVLTP